MRCSLLCLCLCAASCQGPAGPGPTYLTLVDEEGLEEQSGTHYDGYQAAPALPADYEDRVAVLHADTGGGIDEAQIHPRYLQVALQGVTVTALDPTKCTAQVTALQDKTASVRYTLLSQTGCRVLYQAQIKDTVKYQAPDKRCWTYQIEEIQNPSFAYVRTGREAPCPSR